MTTPTTDQLSKLADGVLRHLEKPVRGDAALGIAALAIAMCALARAEGVSYAELQDCLRLAHREINPKLDS
jgi:uncharacterized phosphosugar-binding protein